MTEQRRWYTTGPWLEWSDRMETVVHNKKKCYFLWLTQIVVEGLDVLGQPDVGKVTAMQQHVPLRHKVQTSFLYLSVGI